MKSEKKNNKKKHPKKPINKSQTKKKHNPVAQSLHNTAVQKKKNQSKSQK